MKLNDKYSRENFLEFLSTFLPDFKKEIRDTNFDNLNLVSSSTFLGSSKKLDLQIFELDHSHTPNARVALATDGFKIMKQSASFNALVVYRSKEGSDWRLSLMTVTPEANEKGKAVVRFSNPKRYSFFLGPDAKTNTPTKFLISKGQVNDTEDLKGRFSVEVVNKEFYKEISKLFIKLVGGTLKEGKKNVKHKPLLKIPDTEDGSQKALEFAVRLIGRVIFCWFLREKKSENRISLMPDEILSDKAVLKQEDYYHKVLEPIFFEILNKPEKDRLSDFTKKPYSLIPYLNGGLFSPEKDDFYEKGVFQTKFYNNLVIPNNWLREFFELLETYNFTIDENTTFDEELSIDPEMLGRIFENLLAEINPETGESARKSTGSYYTPRTIVNYMVDESLYLYLKQETEIEENKLRAIISYDLTDDSNNPLDKVEKEKVVLALEKVKILDPACGSGAFPIGALQKIVFILQQADPDGELWFKKQLEKASPEFRRDIEKKFSNKEFDFLRKLGVIRECIYGIDIQPIATEISRLRCFLTLIVDERVNDKEENRGIKPLPNLDFKFVTANSLIGLPKLEIENQQASLLPDNKGDIDELKNIRDRYFTSSGIEREKARAEFAEQQTVLAKQMFRDFNHAGEQKNEFMQKITDWKPFTHKTADWFDPEWMFGVKNGFNIVIANPPYNAKLSNDEKKYFKNTFESVKKGRQDTAAIFVELAQKVGSQNFKLSYILPYRLFSRRRNHGQFQLYILNKYSIKKIIYLGAHIGFSANDEFMILIAKGKSEIDNKIDISFKPGVENLNENRLFSTIDQNLFIQKRTINLNLVRFDQNVLEHIRNGSIELEKLCYVKDGIVPYIREGLISETKKDNRYVKFAGTAGKYILSRYFFTYKPLYLCYDINEAKKYITDKIELRKVQLRKKNIFLQRKILTAQNSSFLKGSIDENKTFVSNSLHTTFVRSEYKRLYSLEYLLALINSKLLNYYHNSLRLKGTDLHPQILISDLKKIPIKKLSINNQSYFVEKVKKLLNITRSKSYHEDEELQNQVKKLKEEVDQMVYKLYGLTNKEIKIVEGGAKQ